ncbi:3-phosphoshikimate 1-carboxyvinyltransferase [Porphyromonas gulae]|uniref:3-phosphoshikimate 1-carboxyvinyltransferase n=1 Tax=Porphyromonas gulae TaxID=111105 RepID=A0A0A2FKQ3_9PORP|nr:3-phosphoshikimate 1-carboxyvinyltransferase [Porphyromonas gulae]KGN91578.1 3-phosphoshikimate 1-carboxyvinyltransferase [Porphyromonas gulae]
MKRLHCTFNPKGRTTDVSLRLPLSKSEWIRLLLLRAMSGEVLPPLGGDAPTDVQTVHRILTSDISDEVNVRDAGTAMRFLTAYMARFVSRPVRLYGTERMYARPIRPLVEALRSLGADVTYEGVEDFPPLLIRPAAMCGGTVCVDAGVSSQFVSALLLIAPTLSGGLSIKLENREVSAPYTGMTCRLLTAFGIEVERSEDSITVGERPFTAPMEWYPSADWSAAGYIYNMVAVGELSGRVSLPDLLPPDESMQADSRAAALFGRLGVVTEKTDSGIVLSYSPVRCTDDFGTEDVRDCPDLVPTLAVCCLLKGVPFCLEGVGHLRLKECDRLAAICAEARKLGYVVRSDEDALLWDGERCMPEKLPVIRVYDDHRMAMAFAAAAALSEQGVMIEDAGVVGKSFPGFFSVSRLLGFDGEEI